MRRFTFIGVALAGMMAAATAMAGNEVARYQPGQDYKVIDKPVKRSASAPIRVREFFLYSCPHCFKFEPTLEKWIQTLGDDVVFDRSPVLFGSGAKTYARIYYTERQLGVLDQLHRKIFDAIHKQHRSLQSRGTIRAFFKQHGVSGKRFKKAYDSQSVKQNVTQAEKRMRRFGVRAVPSLEVAGRYWVSGRAAGSNERMLKVAKYLIAKTRRARQSSESE
ncbi:thiol:disulfide interchange protein DsbA/DsbL [Salinisphaera sp. USBA-960]|nr:thiol:disulfide interchange protein DsbA/DsbL [Salifodinibacter halophilus]NNC27059.1 thiol:disulfide interchange protein DsbA/DsbL [Salifodinibacter halophilus]